MLYNIEALFYSVAPTDLKFVTCAEDKVLKIWDLPTRMTESEKNGFFLKTIKKKNSEKH